METYPDSLTYDLLDEAVTRTGVPSEELLRRLGHVWVRFTVKRGYGDLLDLSGDTLPEVLARLDALHAELASVYPELRPPRFESELVRDGLVELAYFSEREGLAPFVVGLVEGLGRRFGIEVLVQHQPKEAKSKPDRFSIHWEPASP